MAWLLTGGAGYIGAHIAAALREADREVVVLDDLSTGLRSRLPADLPVVEASVLDAEAVRKAIRAHAVTGVVHLAAKKAVGESMQRPLYYWRENVGGFERLLSVMADEGVDRIVFSSSAAVYGTPSVERVTEAEPPSPISPYGTTKLAGEWMLRETAAATGMRWASLRYFNVAGCGEPTLADTSVNNLIPLIFKALSDGQRPKIFGADYPTRDGTCIRDYIHVVDLARAHVAAAGRLEKDALGEIYNVGRGEGVTVREVMDVVRDVTGNPFEPEVVDRRPGDPAAYFADPAKIDRDLGWRARGNLSEMVSSAWQAWSK